jgi:hypothetical protein
LKADILGWQTRYQESVARGSGGEAYFALAKNVGYGADSGLPEATLVLALSAHLRIQVRQ